MMQRFDRHADSWIWVSAFILANLRGTVFWDLLKRGFGLTALPWIEVFIWALLFLSAVRSLRHAHLLEDYVKTWKEKPFLILFIVIAFLSLLWTISFPATLYRSCALLFSSLIGAYLGTRYSMRELLDKLFRFGSLLLVLSFALALFFPLMGAMLGDPYNGAWRGVFWHKNQFGPIAALFGMIFLVLAFDEFEKEGTNRWLYIVFYLFSLVNVFFSKSVAGYMTAIITSGFVLLAFGWLQIRHRLTSLHYYGASGLAVLGAILLFLERDFVLGLFNRDASLTGRLPLWNYLLREVIAKRVWIGYGFGAFWSLAESRLEVQRVLGWPFPVAIGDNGFLDILLYVGVLGFIPLTGVLIVFAIRAIRFSIQGKQIVDFFPTLVFLFVFFANLTFSFFLETEVFIWMVLVVTLFQVSGRASSATL